MFTCTFSLIRSGARTPPMYTEMLPGGQLLALIMQPLTETMAGTYYCSASYANTEQLEASVDIQTFCELNFGFVNWSECKFGKSFHANKLFAYFK